MASSSTSKIRNVPPAPTELEVTIFGPGIGECIVIHLGDGQWMVVDSCMSRSTDVPVALDYLRELGVDVGDSVVRIVATHWHDDHIRGLATLLRQCPKAEFVMSLALANQQFFQLVLQGVDGIIRGATKRRRVLTTNPGHVRVRFDLDGGSPDPAIDLFGSARSL